MKAILVKPLAFLLILFFCSNYTLANKQVLDSLISLSQSKEIKKQQAAYLGLAEFYFKNKNSADKSKLEVAFEKIAKIPTKNLRQLFDDKIKSYELQNKIDQVINLGKIALKEALRRKDSNFNAHCHKILSSCYLKKYNFKQAQIHLDKAFNLYTSLKDEKNAGYIVLQKSRLEYAKGNYYQSIEQAIEAAEVFKKTDQNKQLAITYLQLGNMYYFLNEPKKAGVYYRYSKTYFLLSPDSIGWAISHSNIGLIKLDQDSFSRALSIQYEALPKIKESKRTVLIGNSYHYIGMCYIGLGNADSAKKYITKSIEINRKTKYQDGVLMDKIALGQIALLNDQLDSALLIGKSIAKSLDTLKSYEIKRRVFQLLADCYEKSGEEQKALFYLKEYIQIKDSLDVDQENIKDKASLEQKKLKETQYQLELAREKEKLKRKEYKTQQFLIVILSITSIVSIFFAILVATTNRRNKSLNKLLKNKQKRLEEELKNKQALLREIHHRVKNNLQIISSMLSIQSKYIDDKKLHDVIKESQSRISSMALIHESLYKREKNQHSLFSSYVKELIPNLISTYHLDESKVSLKMEISDIELSLDDSIPCGLIINEVLTNALKHAFPDGKEGVITIKMKSEGEQISLFISDNGVGFPANKIPNPENSFGTLLINSLVNQLDAKMEIGTANGVAYSIQWQAKSDKLLE